MFCAFYKIIIFIVNKEKDDIRSAYCKFLQLGDKPHCSQYFHASERYENTLVDQSKCTYYPNYFINVDTTFSMFDFKDTANNVLEPKFKALQNQTTK